ncbi:MAG TPA: ABC transporter permease [Micromonosporaceae bacterium]|nr:ABC transporter permease [Micromonosporaceae bacterium]
MSFIHQAILWLNDPLNWTNPGGIFDDLRQHLFISGLALLFACVIGLPLGIWFGHSGRGGGSVVAFSNTTRAIPTYALLAVIYVAGIAGIGAESAVPALAIFGIPPILANAYTGIRQVEPEVRDAARGMGMSGLQMLGRVELPLAVPYIAAGIRTAAVQIVATATLAALVAGGGLGNIIYAGFGLTIAVGGGQILAGGILVALLALLVNGVLGIVVYYVTPKPLRNQRASKRRSRRLAAETA